MSDSNKKFLLNLFEHVPPSHVALFLRLLQHYPINIRNDTVEREQTLLAIVNETTNSHYEADLWPHILSVNRTPELANQILLHNEHELLLRAIDKLQNRFELQPHRFHFHQFMPIAKICFNCGNHLGEPKFDEICSVVTRDNIYPCVMYKAECCELIYKYGHIRHRRTHERFVEPDMIFKQPYIHLFDHLVYERALLITFTNLLSERAANFQSYTNAINLTIDQNRNSNKEPSTTNKLYSKCFSITWTWFEICRYLFFMTTLEKVQIPDIIQRSSHNLYYEMNATFFYELFIKFWSNHGQVPDCCCQSKKSCMLNFVFDTHMKAHRLVCSFTGLCDETVPELGAVAVGCPRPPLRSSSSIFKSMTNKEIDIAKHYCEHHYKFALNSTPPQSSLINEAIEVEEQAEEFENNDICTVHRDEDDTQHKRRTAGFMAVMSNCNIIIGWSESVRSEGMRRSVYQLLKILHLGGKLPPAAAYDSACTFVSYLRNQYNVSIKPSTLVDEIMAKKYCIDRFHRRNHVRPECKTTLSCNYIENQPYFDQENTQVCEQLFSDFTKLKATLRSTTWPYSNIFYTIIFHLRNCQCTKIYPDNPFLAAKSGILSPTTTLYNWAQTMASNVNFSTHMETQEDSEEEN